MATCTAVTRDGRIQLDIRRGEEGYEEFAKVLNAIEAQGCMSWYGDIVNAEGKEQSGLIITTPPLPQGDTMTRGVFVVPNG